MATIYQKDGKSVYDNNGVVTDAKTGLPVSSGPAPAAPAAVPGQSEAQRTAAYNATGVTDVPPATGNPIIDSGIRRHVTADTTGSYGSFADAFFGGLKTAAPSAGDKQAIKDQAYNDVSAVLDSIDKTYASKLAAESIRATDRLGSGRSINARSGLLGQDMGDQRNQGIVDKNTAVSDAILAERDAAKAAVMDKANQRAYDMIQAETTQAMTNAGSYMAYLKEKQTAAKADVSTLAKSGVSLDQLSDSEYQTLLNQSGYGNSFLFNAVYNSQLPANAKKDFEYVNLGGGKVAAFDKATGKPTMYDYSVPEGYTFKMAGDIPIFVNEKTQDVKIASPSGDLASAGGMVKETELDSYTNSAGKRVSVMYNPITHGTRTIVTGSAQKNEGGGFPTGFKPQSFEVSAVSQFLANEGKKQGQTPQQIQEAISTAQNDPTFFYSVLGTVTSDKTYSDLYYKPTTIGIPASFVSDVNATPAGQ